MKVGIFIPPENAEHIRMLMSFAVGLKKQGVDPLLLDVRDYQPVDVAIVFGVGKKNVPVSWPRGEVLRRQQERNKHTIVIEKGFVNRDEYYMVGVDGLNNRALFFNEQSPSDRWEQLGVELSPWRSGGEHVVVCGQVPSDASVQNVDIIQWSIETVTFLRKYTDRKLVFRPHPLAVDRTPHIMGTVNSTRSLRKDLKNAWAVVTYNSNAAVEAAIEGVPVFAVDRGSMAWDVSNHELLLIESPQLPVEQQMRQWAYNLAYTQWNEAEFEQGLPWEKLSVGLAALSQGEAIQSG